MGSAVSYTYNQVRRVVLRYNVENRAHKFLEKQSKLPVAPRHSVPKDIEQLLNEKPQIQKQLEELNIKNEQLDEYLKKVYLTSPPEEKRIASSRPKPVKRVVDLKQMFYEPENAKTGFCTLSNIIDIMAKFQEDPKAWNANNIANYYDINQKDVVNLLAYYSLLKIEKFEFMNQDAESEPEEQKEIEFGSQPQLKSQPLKQIEGKK